MPELPEVETVCRGLAEKILYLKVRKVKIINHKLRYHIPLELEKIFLEAEIKAVVRRGVSLQEGV